MAYIREYDSPEHLYKQGCICLFDNSSENVAKLVV